MRAHARCIQRHVTAKMRALLNACLLPEVCAMQGHACWVDQSLVACKLARTVLAGPWGRMEHLTRIVSSSLSSLQPCKRRHCVWREACGCMQARRVQQGSTRNGPVARRSYSELENANQCCSRAARSGAREWGRYSLVAADSCPHRQPRQLTTIDHDVARGVSAVRWKVAGPCAGHCKWRCQGHVACKRLRHTPQRPAWHRCHSQAYCAL
jgi:hypothetical protein